MFKESKTKLKKFGRYLRTVQHLKTIQIISRIKLKFIKTKPDLSSSPQVREIEKNWRAPIKKNVSLHSLPKITILNQTNDISKQDIWNDSSLDKLWLYNLHYFNCLITEDNAFLEQQQKALIQRWIDENPPGKGYGWEPYPISIRVINWVKWIFAGHMPSNEMNDSLAIQARFLMQRIEYHLLGNHLIANAKALLFVGLYFQGKDAAEWFNKGKKILSQELKEQILKDGGHFERSPMYHAIILEDLLDIINLFHYYKVEVPEEYTNYVTKMFHWLEGMVHPDGKISFFSDAAFNVGATLKQLLAYARELGIIVMPLPVTNLIKYDKSGFYRIKRHQAALFLNAGSVKADYIPGHAHADALSFELSIDQQRVLVNSGISNYRESAQRLYERGTKAHNTLMIDKTNSSEVWKNFRMGRRAKVFNIMSKEHKYQIEVTATHDGYFHKNDILHSRSWQLRYTRLVMTDVVTGEGEHDIDLWFHVHPNCYVEKNGDNELLIYKKDQDSKRKNYFVLIRLDPQLKTTIEDSSYYPEFGKAVPNQTICCYARKKLPVALITQIKWQEKVAS